MAQCLNKMRRIFKRIKLSNIANRQHASVPLVLLAACQTDENIPNSDIKRQPFKLLNAGEMSHEALIRQACSLAASSSSQLITQVLVAITETSQDYRKAMAELMSMIENNIVVLSNSQFPIENEIEDLIVAHRNKVDDYQRSLLELISLMDYVEKTVTATAETAFLAGAEQSSTIMCERLNSALQKVGLECAANKDVEDELLKLQQMFIVQLSEDSSKNDIQTRVPPPGKIASTEERNASKETVTEDSFDHYSAHS